jgi:MFS family permease
MGVSASTAPGPDQPLPGARTALVLLLAINLFNFIDRQVLAAVEPEIRTALLAHDDPDAKFKMGLLSTAFLVAFMVFAPLFGWLALTWPRWALVGVGVILWSLASGASGFDWGLGLGVAFWALLTTRALVGVGEAAYGPVAPDMISDMYPVRRRGAVLAWFYLAAPIGGALGYALGDIVGKHPELGWRWAFYLVMPPGVVLGLLCFLMREPPRGRSDPGAVLRPLHWRDYLVLLRCRSLVLDILGMTAMMFVLGGLAFWMPAYLEEKVEQRMAPVVEARGGPDRFTAQELAALRDETDQALGLFGVSSRITFGALTALSGVLATLLGGLAGDWLRRYVGGAYLLVSGGPMVLGFPLLLWFLATPFPLAWLPGFLAVFCLFFNTGPTNAVLANVTHPLLRATVFGLTIFVMHALGDAISPPVIGLIADRHGLTTGFVVVSVVMLAGGVFWLWGARYLARDTEHAPRQLGAMQAVSDPGDVNILVKKEGGPQ